MPKDLWLEHTEFKITKRLPHLSVKAKQDVVESFYKGFLEAHQPMKKVRYELKFNWGKPKKSEKGQLFIGVSASLLKKPVKTPKGGKSDGIVEPPTDSSPNPPNPPPHPPPYM